MDGDGTACRCYNRIGVRYWTTAVNCPIGSSYLWTERSTVSSLPFVTNSRSYKMVDGFDEPFPVFFSRSRPSPWRRMCVTHVREKKTLLYILTISDQWTGAVRVSCFSVRAIPRAWPRAAHDYILVIRSISPLRPIIILSRSRRVASKYDKSLACT